jgi:hypothetical protein
MSHILQSKKSTKWYAAPDSSSYDQSSSILAASRNLQIQVKSRGLRRRCRLLLGKAEGLRLTTVAAILQRTQTGSSISFAFYLTFW